MIKMYKKAGSKIISVYWFAMILLVAGGIFGMVYLFYSHPYDVRELEAEALSNSIANCLSNQGEINKAILDSEGFNESFKNNFLEECHLNLNSEDIFGGIPQYYLEIHFFNSNNLEKSLFNFSEGNLNLISSCEIQKEKEYQREAVCLEKEFFSLDKFNEELYLIKILTIVRKTEKNVK